MSSEISLFHASKKRKRVDDAQNDPASNSQGRNSSAAAKAMNAEVADSSSASHKSKASKPGVTTAAPHFADFAALGLSKWLVGAVKTMGIRVPTPIQAGCIPPALQGRDVVGCAQTGSGKTAAFALPVLQALGDDPYGIFAVVLTPSRELAFQIAEQFQAFGAPLGVRVATITGGMDIVKQGLELAQYPHIVVATPGRLAHHLSLGVSPPDLSRAPWLILDECDRLADASMAPDLNKVISACTHPKRQTLMFSATVPPMLRAGDTGIAGLSLTDPFVFDVNAKRSEADGSEDDGSADDDDEEGAGASSSSSGAGASGVTHEVLAPVTAPNLTQQYLFMPSTVKNAYLLHTLTRLGPEDLVASLPGQAQGSGGASSRKGHKGQGGQRSSTAVSGKEAFQESAGASDIERARSLIIFVSTCHSAALVTEFLRECGVPCASLHSVMSQQERLASLAKFKGSIVRVLVATDVASRGLDIPTVDLVLNYDVPRVPSDYVHRVGRTARAGRPGRAVTLITQYDVDLLHAIETSVLRGKKLEALPEGFVDEDKHILPKLGQLATALHMAKTKLKDNGMAEKLQLYKQRKAEARERRKASEGAGSS